MVNMAQGIILFKKLNIQKWKLLRNFHSSAKRLKLTYLFSWPAGSMVMNGFHL